MFTLYYHSPIRRANNQQPMPLYTGLKAGAEEQKAHFEGILAQDQITDYELYILEEERLWEHAYGPA